MANRFMCGFDDYDSTGLWYEWATTGYGSPGSATWPKVVSGMNGSCLKFYVPNLGYSASAVWKTVMPEGKASFVVGFRYMFDVIGGNPTIPFFMCGDSTRTHLTCQVSYTGVYFYKSATTAYDSSVSGGTLLGSLSAIWIPGVSHYVEFEVTINDSSGVLNVYIDGNSTAAFTFSGDTQNAGTATVTWIGMQSSANSGTSHYFDDIYVNDTTGSYNNGLEGDVRVYSHMPNANGNSSQWDRSTGSDQYATIDDNPQDTADYNSTSTLNEVDTVNIASLAESGATIKAVQVNLLAKKTTSGTATIVPVMRVDSVDYPHATNLYVPADWIYLKQNYDQQADSTNWNETDFNATEVGYKKTA